MPLTWNFITVFDKRVAGDEVRVGDTDLEVFDINQTTLDVRLTEAPSTTKGTGPAYPSPNVTRMDVYLSYPKGDPYTTQLFEAASLSGVDATHYFVDYTVGRVYFHSSHIAIPYNGKAYFYYWGTGSIVWARDVNDVHAALDDLNGAVLFADGSTLMNAALDMGGQSITNVNLVDSIDVSAHAHTGVAGQGVQLDHTGLLAQSVRALQLGYKGLSGVGAAVGTANVQNNAITSVELASDAAALYKVSATLLATDGANLGIGTTQTSSARLTFDTTIGVVNTKILFHVNGVNNAGIGVDASNNLVIFYPATSALKFRVNATNAAVSMLSLDSSGNMITFGNHTVGGDVNATTFYGDGSNLTGIDYGGVIERRESFIVGTATGNYTGSTTIFRLLNPYRVTGLNLQVFYDGVLMRAGVGYDYVETDTTTFTFATPRIIGRTVVASWDYGSAPTALVDEYRRNFVATAGQLTFSTAPQTYNAGGTQLRVYIDGILLTLADDYTETDATTITLTIPCIGGEKVSLLWSAGAGIVTASYLNGFSASATPLPNTLLALDTSSKYPASVMPTEFSRKNAIINGNFDIWQNGTSFPALANGAYSADRFKTEHTGATVLTISQSSDVPTVAQSGCFSNYSLCQTITTADTSIAAAEAVSLLYRVEGYDFKRFVGKTGTLSFWVKAVKTGVYCVGFRNAGSDRSYIAEYTIFQTNTWEKKTITLDFNYSGGTWDYANGIGLQVSWAIATGSDYQTTANTWQTGNYLATINQVNGVDSISNTFYLSQIQLEAWPVATNFEERPIQQELAMCQRYCCKSYNLTVNPGTSTYNGMATTSGSDNDLSKSMLLYCVFPVSMRGTPVVTVYDSAGNSGRVTTVTAPGVETNNVVPSLGVIATSIGQRSFVVGHTGTVARIQCQYVALIEL